jgi:hypothetical protein
MEDEKQKKEKEMIELYMEEQKRLDEQMNDYKD